MFGTVVIIFKYPRLASVFNNDAIEASLGKGPKFTAKHFPHLPTKKYGMVKFEVLWHEAYFRRA